MAKAKAPLQSAPRMGRPPKWTDQKIEEEAEFLFNWCQQDDAIVIATCYGMRGYSYQRSEEFEKRSENYAEAKSVAKTIIGARREQGALLGKLDSSIVKASMATYDPDHRRMMLDMKVANSQSNIPKSVMFTFSGREEDNGHFVAG